MATKTYNAGFLSLLNGGTAWATDDVYAILVNATGQAAFNRTHNTYSQVSANELTPAGGGYSRIAVTGKAVEAQPTANDVRYNCSDVSFGSDVTIDASGGMIIFVKGTHSSPQAADPLLFAWDLPDPASSTNGTFTVRVPNGIVVVSDAA